MLVLSREPGEAIRIGAEIEVAVLGIVGGRVKLGIRAPKGVPVRRVELVTDNDDPSARAVGDD